MEQIQEKEEEEEDFDFVPESEILNEAKKAKLGDEESELMILASPVSTRLGKSCAF